MYKAKGVYVPYMEVDVQTGVEMDVLSPLEVEERVKQGWHVAEVVKIEERRLLVVWERDWLKMRQFGEFSGYIHHEDVEPRGYSNRDVD